jgi:hypothetical protein
VQVENSFNWLFILGGFTGLLPKFVTAVAVQLKKEIRRIRLIRRILPPSVELQQLNFSR